MTLIFGVIFIVVSRTQVFFTIHADSIAKKGAIFRQAIPSKSGMIADCEQGATPAAPLPPPSVAFRALLPRRLTEQFCGLSGAASHRDATEMTFRK
jgi:hypothetical protein